MEDLLLLVHRIPYPPNKGDKIRSYHLLRHLAQHYRVHLGTFVDDEGDWQYADTVRTLCVSTHFARLDPRRAKLRSLQGLLRHTPLSLDYYRDAGMQRWVEQCLAQYPDAKILVFSSAMAQFVTAAHRARRVIDFVDIDSDKWRQYAQKKSWPMSWVFRREARLLLDYERSVARAFDASLFVSQAEADLFKKLAPESAAKTGFFSNGVDTDFFSPAPNHQNPYAQDEMPIVFTGAMDYWPNVDAVQWFADDMLPALRARHPSAVFYIVGSRPSAQVQTLATRPGIRVTGTVADVRPYLAHASAAVAPMRIARGIQNKVLEAMAMGKPTVVSPQALEGIDAKAGSEVLLADGAEAFVAALSALFSGSFSKMGANARAKVQADFSWTAHLKDVDALLGDSASENTVTSAAPRFAQRAS